MVRETSIGSELSLMRVPEGGIIYLHLPGQPTLVLNTLKSALDLLEQRSQKYSSRPRSIMIKL